MSILRAINSLSLLLMVMVLMGQPAQAQRPSSPGTNTTGASGAGLEEQQALDEIAQEEEQEPLDNAEQGIEEQFSQQLNLDEPGLSGVLVDRTITMIGKTFYRQFSQLSMESGILSNTNLSIHERPSARWGSLIWISEGSKIIFEATLSPRLSDVDQYAEAAIEQVEQRVIQSKVMDALQKNEDLADEEL
ncbi:CsgE family curli-type amyloid fiber assembly protein [Halomonas korlensis]|uniref:Curli production assembly/transport component CsgE n=1 Tax=Halomonas korlensis TaxID=463301 RepID=A0A1I7GP77_9GAMM|nr:CsgE family curli-type amyloid fiber assembly protein [Halomonas korlensis]SFU50248.1 Curli assembly protein CsgE [Halomonas korlensis]